MSDIATRDSALGVLQTLEDAGILTETSFDLPRADLPFEEYVMVGVWLGKVRDTSAFWFADWINYGENVYGEKYTQALEATGRSLSTLQNYAYVGSHVKPSARRSDISFSHHAEVAKLPHGEQRSWLKRAVEESWSVEALRRELRNGSSDEQPAWTERQRAEAEREQQRVLAELVEAAGDPECGDKIEALAERAKTVLAKVDVPAMRKVKCPSCGIEFDE